MPKHFREYDSKIYEIEKIFSSYCVFLPEKYIEQFQEFQFKCSRYIVELYHFENEYSINCYDKLTSLHSSLVNLSRQDLAINTLNKKLKYRLEE